MLIAIKNRETKNYLLIPVDPILLDNFNYKNLLKNPTEYYFNLEFYQDINKNWRLRLVVPEELLGNYDFTLEAESYNISSYNYNLYENLYYNQINYYPYDVYYFKGSNLSELLPDFEL